MTMTSVSGPHAALVGVEVLVLDGDQRVHAGIEQLLSEASLHVTCTDSAQRALALVDRQFFSVALVDIDTLLARADIVSLNLVLNDDTRGFLDAKRIARMKPGALLVNTARGALVDEAALIDALKSGHIRHAGLDVFHNEPLKADHPLAQLPNVTLSAHAAFRTLEASMTLLRRAIEIVKGINAA